MNGKRTESKRVLCQHPHNSPFLRAVANCNCNFMKIRDKEHEFMVNFVKKIYTRKLRGVLASWENSGPFFRQFFPSRNSQRWWDGSNFNDKLFPLFKLPPCPVPVKITCCAWFIQLRGSRSVSLEISGRSVHLEGYVRTMTNPLRQRLTALSVSKYGFKTLPWWYFVIWNFFNHFPHFMTLEWWFKTRNPIRPWNGLNWKRRKPEKSSLQRNRIKVIFSYYNSFCPNIPPKGMAAA